MTAIVKIRDYRPGDEPGWLACWGRVAVTSHAWGQPPYQAKPGYSRPSVQLVAESTETGEIVGFFDVEIENEPGELGLLRDSRCGFVWEIGLIPGLRGRGLGRELVEAGRDRLVQSGIRRMEFWSMDPLAQGFYQRLGMSEINRHWRFWTRLPEPIAAGAKDLGADVVPASLRFEMVHATCSVGDWPKVRETWPLVTDPPLEPHLCLGFVFRY